MLLRKTKATWQALLVCAVFAATGATASASIIPITSGPGLEGLGSFVGSIEYDETTFELTITLTNDSNPLNGGLITGFVLNIASQDANASASLLSATHPFIGVTNHPAPPFGSFTAGAALGADWTGGGSPAGGIAVGATGTFVFAISASDAMLLTASSFVGDGDSIDFVVRFRGFADGGSDKVPGKFDDSIIPGPSVLALLAIYCAMGRIRRRS